ncbi:MAG: FAD-dependent oxidoreductase [Candidatus Binatia bacterium]
MSDFVDEPARRTRVAARTQVLVVGGGSAGVAAAVAAARQGADTLLVERYGGLGGLATGGLIALLLTLASSARSTPPIPSTSRSPRSSAARW